MVFEFALFGSISVMASMALWVCYTASRCVRGRSCLPVDIPLLPNTCLLKFVQQVRLSSVAQEFYTQKNFEVVKIANNKA